MEGESERGGGEREREREAWRRVIYRYAKVEQCVFSTALNRPWENPIIILTALDSGVVTALI